MSNLLENLRGYIENGLEAMKVPGALIAVIKDGELLCADGFGYSDLEAKVKMTADNILPIGSASKAFTATSAVMLAGEGKLDLDTPITEYIAGFRLHDKEASANATARDLLCHRTGMPRHDLMWIGWDDLKREDIVKKWLRNLPGLAPFRSVWQYQNHMFATVGYLIEVISGKTWEDFVQERIFNPLGMSSGNFRVKYPDETGVFAKLYSEKDGVVEEIPPLVIDAMGPAGSINATVTDVAKWVIFNLKGGKVGDKALVDEKVFPQLTKPNIPYELLPFDIPELKSRGYGLGWFVNAYRGHSQVEHGGNVNGASALVSFLPDDNMGVVVLTNADHSMFPYAMTYRIFDELLGCGGQKDWVEFMSSAMAPLEEAQKEQLAAMVGEKIPGKPMLHDLADYVGKYAHPGYGGIEISQKDGALCLSYHGLDLPFEHLHFDVFKTQLEGIPFAVSFKTGADGKLCGLETAIEPALPPATFAKEVNPSA